MLCYAMLCYAFQGAIIKLGFLAKPYQPKGYDDQMALVDPPEGYELDNLATHGYIWQGPNHRPVHDPSISMTIALIAMALLAISLTSGPSILGIWVIPALLSKMARLATVVPSGSQLPSTTIRLASFMAL